MLIGNVLTHMVNTGSVTQILPVFLCLSAVSVTCAYRMAFIIDEVHLNNQRANMVFDDYFRGNGGVPTVKEINNREHFYLPAFMNPHHCKYIRFGERDLAEILTETDSF